MSKQRELSTAEFEVMDVLWRLGQGTVKEVMAALGRRQAYSTVATLLNRLRDKGYVEAQEKNFAYEYHPLVQRQQVVRRKLDELVRRVLGGSIAPLAAYIAETRDLTPEQIAALEDIVKKSKEEKSDG